MPTGETTPCLGPSNGARIIIGGHNVGCRLPMARTLQEPGDFSKEGTMKSIFVVTLLVLVLAPAAWAQAPIISSFEFGVGGGMNFPMGDIGDGMNNGYNFNASLGYKVVPMFIIGAEFGFWGNGATDEIIAALGPDGDMSMKALQFTAMAKYMFPVNVHNFYAKGLVGGYRLAADTESALGDFSVSDTNFGFGVGGGFQFGGMKNSSIYAEGIYHRINGETADGEYVTANVGVLFSFK
jgi:opacity protein-like surface antigen